MSFFSLLSDPQLALTLSFLFLCVLLYKMGKKHVLSSIHNYQQRVVSPIHKAEALLKDAEQAFQTALEAHKERQKNVEDILQLAQSEAEDMLRHAQIRHAQEMRIREKMFLQQVAFCTQSYKTKALLSLFDAWKDNLSEEKKLQKESLAFLISKIPHDPSVKEAFSAI